MVICPTEKIPKELKWAANVARNSEHGIYKMGAIIIYSGQMIALGWNKNKSHPKAMNYTRKIHAELSALVGFRDGDLAGGDMYVVRVTNGGAMATSRPCKYCMVLISEAQLASVTYIDEQGKVITEEL